MNGFRSAISGKTMDDTVETRMSRAQELTGDKRRHARIVMDVPVIVELLRPQRKKNKFAFRAENVSAGGIFIHAQKSFPLGAPVRVCMVLNFDEPSDTDRAGASLVIEVTGHISRLEPEGFAICFNKDYRFVPWQDLLTGDGTDCTH